MGSLNFLFSLCGWTFIPDFATKHLLNFLYHTSPIPLLRVAQPQPGSRQHRIHYALAFAFVIFSYLTYTLYQSAAAMPPNFYQILGVPPNVDENGLKLAFRAFAKRYHPDRPGVGRDGQELFMHVRDAFEALKDPVVRFAYDRFGPDVLRWRQHCKTTREFLRQGLMVSSGYHIVAGIALLFWSAIGRPSVVSFWRYVLFGALFAGELSLILSPFPGAPSNISPPTPSFFSNFLSSSSLIPTTSSSFPSTTLMPTSSILQVLFPNRVPYQHILFLHQIFMFLSVALSRVVPQFIFLLGDEGANNSAEGRKLDALEREIWERIYGTLAIADREASIILHTILQSITPSSSPSTAKPTYHTPTLARMHPVSAAQSTQAFDALTPELRNLVVEANIKNQSAGPIAAAWEAALRLRKVTPRDPASGMTTRNSSSKTDVHELVETPKTLRTKNFWEKEVVEEAESVVALADAASTSSSPTGVAESTQQLRRVPSTPRLGRHAQLNGSPTKSHSPVRKGSFAGEF
ncbi:hypothetical protein BDZ97DRAFT_1846999 [Flammula alnicola]|nr:hypothetical protein BDZ97DRAFT_1846999 [Flammula alnicola]